MCEWVLIFDWHLALKSEISLFITDIDECLEDNGGCDQRCVNENGRYCFFRNSGVIRLSTEELLLGTRRETSGRDAWKSVNISLLLRQFVLVDVPLACIRFFSTSVKAE